MTTGTGKIKPEITGSSETMPARNSFSGMKSSFRKNIFIFAVIFSLVVAAVCCFISNSNSAQPYIITVEGFEIIPGETTGEDIKAAGFQISTSVSIKSDEDYASWDEELEAKSHVYYNIFKDGKRYAHLCFRNESSSSRALIECYVWWADLFQDDYGLFEGTDVNSWTRDSLIEFLGEENMKEHEYTLENDIKWTRGSYSLEFQWKKEGEYHILTARYDEPKTISFLDLFMGILMLVLGLFFLLAPYRVIKAQFPKAIGPIKCRILGLVAALCGAVVLLY